MSSYLDFGEPFPSDSGKTLIVSVRSTSSGELLGKIKWFGRWRQYAFFPQAGTLYNPDCLDAISERVSAMTREKRAAR